jgi:hypothetical protein
MTPLISESLDRRLRLTERIKLKLHLLVCAWCVQYMLQIKLIRTALRLQPIDRSDASLNDGARERICRSLRSLEQDDHVNPAKS